MSSKGEKITELVKTYSEKYFLAKFEKFNDIPNTSKDWLTIWKEVTFTTYCTETEASELRKACKDFTKLQ